MSQRLGEWWRASQQRSDPRTLPAWRRDLYGALQAALRPVQARSARSATLEPPDTEGRVYEAWKRWLEAQRRG